MDPATGKWLDSSANTSATRSWPMTTIGHDQKNAGPPSPMPTPKLPNDPVDTLMKLNAIAKFDRNPSVLFSSGLIPSDRRWASSRAATSDALFPGPDTASSLYHREPTPIRA